MTDQYRMGLLNRIIKMNSTLLFNCFNFIFNVCCINVCTYICMYSYFFNIFVNVYIQIGLGLFYLNKQNEIIYYQVNIFFVLIKRTMVKTALARGITNKWITRYANNFN